MKASCAAAASLMNQAGARQVSGKWLFEERLISLKVGMYAGLETEAPGFLEGVGNQLQEGGFAVDLHMISHADWTGKTLTGQMSDYDLVIGKGLGNPPENVNSYFETRREDAGHHNIFHYSNPRVDALAAQFRQAKTDVEAQDTYHDLHALLAEERPFLFIWKLETKSAWRTSIDGDIVIPYYYFSDFDGWKNRLSR
jgi:ABC-type transport system substrate-binding protein